jgi:hypothetical protein
MDDDKTVWLAAYAAALSALVADPGSRFVHMAAARLGNLGDSLSPSDAAALFADAALERFRARFP